MDRIALTAEQCFFLATLSKMEIRTLLTPIAAGTHELKWDEETHRFVAVPKVS